MTFSGLIFIFKQTALKYDFSWFSGFLSLEANALFTYRHLWLWGSTVTEKCLVWDGYASGKGQSAQWSRWSQEERAVPGSTGVVPRGAWRWTDVVVSRIYWGWGTAEKRRKKIHGFHELAVETCALDIPMNLWGWNMEMGVEEGWGPALVVRDKSQWNTITPKCI